MRAFVSRILPAASAVLALAACDSASVSSTSLPTSTGGTTQATSVTNEMTSVVIRGSVVDGASRPLADAVIECVGGGVLCSNPYTVDAGGHDHRATRTDAQGRYETRASMPRAGARGFLMNANIRGYQASWHEVEWPDGSCTSDQARCTLTANFQLTPIDDHTLTE